ncbi:hypothetical protein [uncultured Oxalicibacterium sp.]|uniref:hypothetical protein n=1 Tax=uncultured Oxalicibacterium sp. TaxID=1168540 RepID=UPI0025D856CC|nr:hypothetical protein [uncultured Oxalicibacterium sp.]
MIKTLEVAEDGDTYHDYCLWEYAPLTATVGKLRSSNLLLQSFAEQDLGPQASAIMMALRAELGVGNVVWGIKQEAGRISWELYFYDYARRERTRSVTRILHILRPWIACDVQINESCDYFMFSLDLNHALVQHNKPMSEVQLYMGNVGSQVSSGICYAVTREAMTMKNFYFFFDAATQGQEIFDKLCSSVYLDLSSFRPETVLWPEMRGCRTIVLANKRTHEGIYFSRITIDQLLFFLKKMAFPTAQIAFAEQQRDRLDHLLFDVGIDYRMEAGEINVLKSAYYGVF